MKTSKIRLSHNYREIYQSSCDCLKSTIIDAMGEIFILTGLDTFSTDAGNGIKVGDDEYIGICIRDNYLHFIVTNGKKTKFINVKDRETDESLKAFDSDMENWLSFIELLQSEFNKGLF